MRQPWQNLRPDTQRYAGLQEATLRRLYKEAGSRLTTSMASSRLRRGGAGGSRFYRLLVGRRKLGQRLVIRSVVLRAERANMCRLRVRLRVGTPETLQARSAYLAPVVVPCVGRKLAGIRRRVQPPRSLAALPHAPQPLSCVPQALHTHPPSLLLQRSGQAP
jgi:hypothetical protein